jgi:hypothetical protein
MNFTGCGICVAQRLRIYNAFVMLSPYGGQPAWGNGELAPSGFL